MDRERAPRLEGEMGGLAGADSRPVGVDNPDRHDRLGFRYGLLGTVLTCSLVLAPAGLPLLWLARRHRQAARRPTPRPAEVSVVDDAIRTLRRHLGLFTTRELMRTISNSETEAVESAPEAVRHSQ